MQLTGYIANQKLRFRGQEIREQFVFFDSMDAISEIQSNYKMDVDVLSNALCNHCTSRLYCYVSPEQRGQITGALRGFAHVDALHGSLFNVR